MVWHVAVLLSVQLSVVRLEYWKTMLSRNGICRLINANVDLVAIQARDGLVSDMLDCNL